MSQPRFEVAPINVGTSFRMYNVYDTVEQRVTATTYLLSDAETITDRLNVTPNGSVRNLMAMELAHFRTKMEQENGGPLIDDPQIALLLADLCDAFHFNEGEIAIVLGKDLILLLATLDTPAPEPRIEDELIIIQA